MRQLFVPFGDLTNGTETYPGGRYLELERTATGIYDLDFNRAFHPFCYYNPKYDCPYPPRENRLTCRSAPGKKWARRGTSELRDDSRCRLRFRRRARQLRATAPPRVPGSAVEVRNHPVARRILRFVPRVRRRGSVLRAWRSPRLEAESTRSWRRWSKRRGASSMRSRKQTDVLYDGAGECIEALAAEYALGIASGALRPEIDAVLRHARPRSSLPLHRRLWRYAQEQAGAGPVPCARRSSTDSLLASASRSRTRDGGSPRRGMRGSHASGSRSTYARQELGLADRIIDSLAEFTPAFVRSLRI